MPDNNDATFGPMERPLVVAVRRTARACSRGRRIAMGVQERAGACVDRETEMAARCGTSHDSLRRGQIYYPVRCFCDRELNPNFLRVMRAGCARRIRRPRTTARQECRRRNSLPMSGHSWSSGTQGWGRWPLPTSPSRSTSPARPPCSARTGRRGRRWWPSHRPGARPAPPASPRPGFRTCGRSSARPWWRW